jgi:hypothetical protein
MNQDAIKKDKKSEMNIKRIYISNNYIYHYILLIYTITYTFLLILSLFIYIFPNNIIARISQLNKEYRLPIELIGLLENLDILNSLLSTASYTSLLL